MRTRPHSLVVASAVALMVAAAAPVSARPVQDEPVSPELEAARQAMVLGDFDEAVRIYEDYREAHPEDLRAFWGLVKAYGSLGLDRERLVPLLEARLEEDPADIRAREELGRAYARLGDHERAHETFLRALRYGPPSVARYSEIGSIEMRHRMYEHSTWTFLEARRIFDDPVLFSQELAQIYAALGEYDAAIDECLTTVTEHPGMVSWATNRVELMLEEGVEGRLIERRIRDVADSDAPEGGVLSFAGSVYLVLDRPDDALAAFIRADELAGGEGDALMEYGMILRDEGLGPQAREGFRLVEERYPGTTNAALAGIEAARILVTEGDPGGAVLELKAVGSAFPNDPVGGEALLEAARIELFDLEHPDAALATIEELSGGPARGGRRLVHEAVLLEADAYLALGRFDDARERAGSVAGERAKGETRERALFVAGYASFLMFDIDRALDELRTMVEDETSGKLANDALRLMLAIAEAKEAQDAAPITLFARAHAAHLAGDRLAAAEHLAELSSVYPTTNVAVEGMMLLGALAEDEGDYRRALEVYGDVIEGTERIPPRAEAMMRRGDILYRAMERPEEALAEYAALLEDLPPNYLSGEARRKFDRIRRSERVEG